VKVVGKVIYSNVTEPTIVRHVDKDASREHHPRRVRVGLGGAGPDG
jgi:hypothetical protein